MTPEIARAAIGRRFPMVDTRDIECIGSGWEFDVYATGDGWAFRFPRRAETEGLFERERPVLEIATSALSGRVAVPREWSLLARQRQNSRIDSPDTG